MTFSKGGDVDGGITSVAAGDNIVVDNTDPSSPEVSLADDVTIAKSFALSRKASNGGDLTSSGETILAVTDTLVARTVTIATADVVIGRQFTIKDEGGNAGINNITITTPVISVDSLTDLGPGTGFNTTTQHNYSTGQVIVQSGFSAGIYNGVFIVTGIGNSTRYEISTIPLTTSTTGISNVAIDGVASTTITVDFGAMTIYCTDFQIFTVVV